MSPRLARFVFGTLPLQTAEFGDACVAEVPALPPAAGTSLLGQLRRRFLSDEALAEHLQSGNADALTILFERHGPRFFGIARRILRNEAEAEDAVQQTFLDAFRSIHQFDPGKGAFKTWLLMFAYQRVFNSRRSLAAHRYLETDPFDELLPELFSGPRDTLGYSFAETSVLIEQVLGQLQPRQRRTIELVYYEGLTAEEVSARTGESVRVVRHNLYRGLERLRRTLGASASAGCVAEKGGAK
ncbi:MAG TPA: sigma-70 family RNA polymerase sigma factor [Silvibacterium sp.]|nr:sigma-70 family RNA polymerase sigma factor [Silvibacterium sp.]